MGSAREDMGLGEAWDQLMGMWCGRGLGSAPVTSAAPGLAVAPRAGGLWPVGGQLGLTVNRKESPTSSDLTSSLGSSLTLSCCKSSLKETAHLRRTLYWSYLRFPRFCLADDRSPRKMP